MKKLLLLFISIPCFAGYVPNAVTSSTLNIVDAKQAAEWAIIANNGTCTISAQGGSLVSSVSHTGTGLCALSFTSGIFSATPACVCVSASGSADVICNYNSGGVPSTSGVTTATTRGSSNTREDGNVQIICMGPR